MRSYFRIVADQTRLRLEIVAVQLDELRHVGVKVSVRVVSQHSVLGSEHRNGFLDVFVDFLLAFFFLGVFQRKIAYNIVTEVYHSKLTSIYEESSPLYIKKSRLT